MQNREASTICVAASGPAQPGFAHVGRAGKDSARPPSRRGHQPCSRLSFAPGSSRRDRQRRASTGVPRYGLGPRASPAPARRNRAAGRSGPDHCAARRQRARFHPPLPPRGRGRFPDPAVYAGPDRGGDGQARPPSAVRRLGKRAGARFTRSCPPKAPAEPPRSPAILPFNGSARARKRFCWPIWTRWRAHCRSCSRSNRSTVFSTRCNASHELDADLWNAMVTPVNGIDVLLAPELMVEGAQDLHDPSPVIDYARHAYDVVMIDAGGVYGDWNLNIARMSSELLLVTTNELPALQATQRALSLSRCQPHRALEDPPAGQPLSSGCRPQPRRDRNCAAYRCLRHSAKRLRRHPEIADGRQAGSLEHRFRQEHPATRRPVGRPREAAKKSTSLGGLLGLFSKTSKT